MTSSNGARGQASPSASGTDHPAQRPSTEPGFRKRDYPPDLQRGLFTLFLDDEEGQHVSQVWASTPGGAAALMAPWSEGRLRRAHPPVEVPVELVGWDAPETPAELSERSGIAEDELDPGCLFGTELNNVWQAEHKANGRTATLFVIETVYLDPY